VERLGKDSGIYSICSISKLFTSIALMQQYDAGKVLIDEPITTYFFAIVQCTSLSPECGFSWRTRDFLLIRA
jgi:CubicO group peptidase (beta-lactamase class C family)